VASGTLGTMRLTGQMASMGITMTIFSLYLGRAPIGDENHATLVAAIRTAFLVFGLLCGGGILASLVRGNVRDAEAPAATGAPRG
jgi:hypothetical protein